MRIISIMFLFSLHAEAKRLPKEYRGKTKEQIEKMLKTKVDSISTKMSASIKSLSKQKKKKVFTPYFDEEKMTIASLETFAATIPDNIISSGRPFSLAVHPDSTSKLPQGSYFECAGRNWAQKYDYRIDFECSKLITPSKEYQINAVVLDEYKVSGVKADEVYDGSEESIFGTAIAAGFQTLVNGISGRESTSIGNVREDSAGNTLLSGAQGGIAAANTLMLNRSQQESLIIRVNKNKRVFIQFKERFTYEL